MVQVDTRAELPTIPTPLENRILENFKLSFRFSQGNPQLQSKLMFAIANMYPHDEFIEQFPTPQVLDYHLKARALRLHLPVPHTDTDAGGNPITEVTMRGILTTEWWNQCNILTSVQRLDAEEGLDLSEDYASHEDLILSILKGITERDQNYMDTARPGRGKNDDPHESFLITYVVKKKDTGSPDFNTLFEEVREALFKVVDSSDTETAELRSDLDSFMWEWEQLHPGEKFLEETTVVV